MKSAKLKHYLYLIVIGVFGGGARGPLEKLISLAGEERELGRTEM